MVSHECVETQIQGGTTGIETVRLYPPLTEENLSWAGLFYANSEPQLNAKYSCAAKKLKETWGMQPGVNDSVHV